MTVQTSKARDGLASLFCFALLGATNVTRWASAGSNQAVAKLRASTSDAGNDDGDRGNRRRGGDGDGDSNRSDDGDSNRSDDGGADGRTTLRLEPRFRLQWRRERRV